MTHTLTRTPTPTPTLTATKTLTPTATCNGTAWVVNECLNTCISGECFCDFGGTTTIYLGPSVTPGDLGYFPYSDPCMTNIWYGFYEYGGSIYEASQIQLVCNVGGTC